MENNKKIIKVLLAVDVQNDFTFMALQNEDAISKIPGIIGKINEYNKMEEDNIIVATLDTHDDNYLSTLEGTKLPIKHCIEGTVGHKAVGGVRNSSNINYITKNTFGHKDIVKEINNLCFEKGFISSKDEEVQYIFEMCGFCTDICVVSNALILRAEYPEAEIRVFKELCSGTTKENHEAALKVMQSCQIDIV